MTPEPAAAYADILNRFKECNILVVGDLILDHYMFGKVSRISPEAPVPVLHQQREEYVLGGAANVAHNIRALGGKVALAGRVGKDAHGDKILDLCKGLGIDTKFVMQDAKYPTILKTRVIAQNQQLIRIDKEDPTPDSVGLEKELPASLSQYDVIIVSDYAKGVVTLALMSRIAEIIAANGTKVIVDPKPRHIEFYTGAYLVTPNLGEAEEITGLRMEHGYSWDDIGRALKAKLQTNILITLGADGMVLYEGRKVHFPTKATEVYDVSGAGDTVVSTLALALAANADLEQAVNIANHAAGVVVRKLGTATLAQKELLDALQAE